MNFPKITQQMDSWIFVYLIYSVHFIVCIYARIPEALKTGEYFSLAAYVLYSSYYTLAGTFNMILCLKH